MLNLQCNCIFYRCVEGTHGDIYAAEEAKNYFLSTETEKKKCLETIVFNGPNIKQGITAIYLVQDPDIEHIL